MTIDNYYVVTPETPEEIRLANQAILDYRAEKQRQEKLREHESNITFAIAEAVCDIGIDETRAIVKSLLRDLRRQPSYTEEGD